MRRLGLVLCVVAAGCAGPSAKSAPSAPAAMAPAALRDPHAEIDALDRQIADDLTRARVALPVAASCSGAGCATAMSTPFTTPLVTDAACRPAASDRCTDACTLSTSICSNQQKICELAQQLTGDDWAANKCERARASCKAAHDSCCSCAL